MKKSDVLVRGFAGLVERELRASELCSLWGMKKDSHLFVTAKNITKQNGQMSADFVIGNRGGILGWLWPKNMGVLHVEPVARFVRVQFFQPGKFTRHSVIVLNEQLFNDGCSGNSSAFETEDGLASELRNKVVYPLRTIFVRGAAKLDGRRRAALFSKLGLGV